MGHFKIVLQEQVSLKNGKVWGAEALVRYVDQAGKLVLPNSFITKYETEGTIQQLDLQMLRQVCSLLSSWQKRGFKRLPVALNVSAQTILEPGIVEKICAVLDSYAIPHEDVALGISDGIKHFAWKNFAANCTGLTALGFKLCLDKFGSQYGSIMILNQIPFQLVKIDRSITRQLESNERLLMAYKAVIQICRDLGLKVVGEGVETAAQAATLQRLECQLGQGDYWGKPLEVEAFEQRTFNQRLM